MPRRTTGHRSRISPAAADHAKGAGAMARVRYETFCGGRLLKVTGQVDVSSGGAEADGTEFVDGQYWWKVDEQRVADDVAQAMLDKYQDETPADVQAVYDVYRKVMEEEGMTMLGWNELEP